jgi:hypothetical protein
MANNDRRTKTDVLKRNQPAADALPAAFDEDQPAAPLAIRPVERCGSDSATRPQYPRASTALARQGSRSDLAASGACASSCSEDEVCSCCCDRTDDDEDTFGDSPGGHVSMAPPPPDPLADRLAAVFGASARGPNESRANTPARATNRSLTDRRPARLPPHPRQRRDGGDGGGDGDA